MKEREEDKFVGSFARWLACLRPKMGKKEHYFERYVIPTEVLEALKRYRGLKVCPFCNKVFKKTSGYITHLISKHKHEIVDLVADRLR
jgi:hypothetical protein